MADAENFKCYKRLINTQLLQVSVLWGTPFFSYLPKRSTQIYRAQYGDAMLVPLWGAPTWRPEINENIWNSLLLWQRLLFPRELVYIHINISPNAVTVQTAKNHKKRPFFSNETALSRCRLKVTYGGNLEKWRSYTLNTKDATELETCKRIHF